ncbi:uncharacterized protein F4807DRAFT_126753 [Annulohypoxylon truncatum]|uniref:uncharacterized protein n=1 Tax=Annulohypoxylon truncatum TaxID=327061 RepID=UPI00200857DD|nr:uncharacterized protein F4807DRAFT_126753 [Annulohypoxylon truncatum]KAI1214398.1 hypothetical protein F4807DRAFT_126753 [Annulohypoxylon truncatum]
MSYPPAKRQRSNTSRESANGTPQTTAPALRHHQVNPGLSIYSPTGYENGGYSLQPTARQAVTYNPYSPGPVTNSAGGYAGTYQTSSAAYSAGPYSPQQQANSFAAHYSQAAPNGHMASHPSHYTQAGVNGIRNGNFAETQAQTQTQTLLQSQSPQPGTGGTYSPVPTNHHVTSYQHQQPRTNPPTSTIPQHPQHPLSQYGEPYTTQPTAHATSYHTNANSYSDPSTLNSHFSPAHLPSPAHLHSPAPLPTPIHQNGNSLTPEDMQDDDDDEDALGEAADESTEVYTNPDLSKTSIPSIPSVPTPPVDTSSRGSQRFKKCSCKTGRGDKKACVFCVCSKQGLSCNPTCSCGDACANPFTDLTQFFGSPPAFPKPCGANACFATWLCNQPNVEELDTELIIDILLYDDTSWASIQKNNEPFKKWEESWKRARGGKRKKNREDRERLEFELLRGALGNCNQNDFYGHWYSFCQGGWVPTDAWYHCQECRLCKPSQEWHCDKHNRCTTGGGCPECASAVPYANMLAYPDPGS